MADGVVLVKQSSNGDRPIDNEAVVVGGQTVYRQRIVIASSPTVVVTQVAVTATQIAIPATNLIGRKTISIQALAANTTAVYIGLAGVTSSTGWELAAGAAVDLDLDDTVDLFAVSASGTQRVACLEIGG